jgi:hypothetical protein
MGLSSIYFDDQVVTNTRGAERNNNLSWTLTHVSGMVFLIFTKFMLVHTRQIRNACGDIYTP